MPWPDAWTHTATAQRLQFGAGGVDRVGELVRELGARRVLLVTSPGRQASEDGERVVRALGRLLAGTYAEARPHVPTSSVQGALLQARRDGVDGLVSFGGGSCADLAKAVAFFVEQEAGTPGASHVDRPALPHVVVPTTYAPAALTAAFAMTDERTRTKSLGGGPTLAPGAAVYDPQVTLDLPVVTSAATALDALAACVEVVCSPVRTPEAEVVALAGAAGIARALPGVVDDPVDADARGELLAAAALGARALQNAAPGVHHGLAHLLGGRAGAPHGLLSAVLLPHVMRFNGDAVPDAMARLGQALGDPDDAAGAVARLLERAGVPTRLSACGVAAEDLDAVARLSQGQRAVQRNVRPVGELDARAILEDAY